MYGPLASVSTMGLYVKRFGSLFGVNANVQQIQGYRTEWASTTVLGDVCSYLGSGQNLMNIPNIGQTLYLVSTSDSDKPSGAGAWTVRIVYLDSDGNQQVRTDTLDGVTPVSIGSGYSFIQWMEVASLGSSEVAIGKITISSTNGAATESTTFESIPAGINVSFSARYKVPTGKKAYPYMWTAGSIGNSNKSIYLRAQTFRYGGDLSSVFHVQDRAYLSGDGPSASFLVEYPQVKAGGIIKISALVSNTAPGNQVDANLHVVILDE